MITSTYSIRLRLAVLSLVIVTAAMCLTGFGLTRLFLQQIELRVGQETGFIAQSVEGFML